MGRVFAVALLLCAAGCVGAVNSAKTNPVMDLVPRPVRWVAKADASVSGTVCAKVKVVRADVPGAPAEVKDEAYVLDIAEDGVTITAGDARGERYARVTLDQLLKLGGGEVPCCTITDWPALRWRGYMNDCGRNFLALDGVKAVLDMMGRYKMNLFHWHLSDYHGWRLESKKYPQLQKPETFLRQKGKYYTQDEFREIVRYAAARGITVMPELDVPGHTLAFRRGMGIATMKAPGTEKVISDLFEELCSLATKEEMPFVHLGTDEVRVKAEYCDDAWPTLWAKTINRCGRRAVVWAPGKKIDPSCDVIDMAWYDNHITNAVNPVFDSARMYNASWNAFDILPNVTFKKPCRWNVKPGLQIGAITCTWHDDNVGDDTLDLFRECMVFPSIVGFADNFWSGRKEDHPEFCNRMPSVSSPHFATVADVERRMLAQRDRVLADFAYPFPFVKQTHLRWRMTDADTGAVIARDIAQGSVWVWNRDLKKNAFVTNGNGHVTLETWIRSPRKQTVGAWIDCAGLNGVYGRLGDVSTPDAGEWNKLGAKVYLNGVEITPPAWKQPNMKSTTKAVCEQDTPYSTDLLEKPLADELFTLRPPREITLEAGWNHVKLDLPKKKWSNRWVGTFSPLLGTSEHPREVPDLEFSADPPAAE